MEVQTLWITRKSEPDASPELLVAWDEYSIDQNYKGYQEDVDRALASVGQDVAEYRFITLIVSRKELDNAFKPVRLEVATEVRDDV